MSQVLTELTILLGWRNTLLTSLDNVIPWGSFDLLDSLLLEVTAKYTRKLGSDDNNPSDLFLSGPSRLPHLSSLQINFKITFSEVGTVQPVIESFYRRAFDKTFAEPQSFLTLRTFRTKIEVFTPIPHRYNKQAMVRHIEDQLPSVFGPGGRGETHGWKTAAESKLMDDGSSDEDESDDEFAETGGMDMTEGEYLYWLATGPP